MHSLFGLSSNLCNSVAVNGFMAAKSAKAHSSQESKNGAAATSSCSCRGENPARGRRPEQRRLPHEAATAIPTQLLLSSPCNHLSG